MRQFLAITNREIKKTLRNRLELFSGLAMGLIFLLIFGVLGQDLGDLSKYDILIPGAIATTAFMGSLMGAITVINDIAEGTMKEMIIAPVARWKIALGKILGAMFITFLNVIFVYFVGMLFGTQYPVWAIFPVMLSSMMIGIMMASVGLIAASIVTNQKTYTYVIQLISMPFMFISGAYIPLETIPEWLRWIAYINPNTYATFLNRAYMIDKADLPPMPPTALDPELVSSVTEWAEYDMSQSWFSISVFGVELTTIIGWSVLFTLAIIAFIAAIVATSRLKGSKEYTGLISF